MRCIFNWLQFYFWCPPKCFYYNSNSNKTFDLLSSGGKNNCEKHSKKIDWLTRIILKLLMLLLKKRSKGRHEIWLHGRCIYICLMIVFSLADYFLPTFLYFWTLFHSAYHWISTSFHYQESMCFSFCVFIFYCSSFLYSSGWGFMLLARNSAVLVCIITWDYLENIFPYFTHQRFSDSMSRTAPVNLYCVKVLEK